jgi:hypothetical protein
MYTVPPLLICDCSNVWLWAHKGRFKSVAPLSSADALVLLMLRLIPSTLVALTAKVKEAKQTRDNPFIVGKFCALDSS